MEKAFLLIPILTLAVLSVTGQNLSNKMYGLTKIYNNVKSKRISSYDRSGGNNDRLTDIKDGEKATLFDVKGAGVINHIWITIAPRPESLNRNDIILRMYWDGNPYPSVESPIGAFFGQGWNEQYNFSSLPLAAGPVNGTGLVSYFSMPFASGARIEIENQTGRIITAFYFYVDYTEVPNLDKETGRFHAWYNHELTETLPEGEAGPRRNNTDESRNYVFADIKGKGHFVGINYYVHCPTPIWYGEGDDMWLIDGETVPGMIGTGTEDFFNTSWCPKEKFYHPYYGYPRVNDDIGWLGRTHVYRFFIEDPIFFDKSLKGSIEHGHDNNLTLDIGTVAYWYQSEASPLPPAPSKELLKPKPLISPKDIHEWRDEWRKNKGNTPNLWGNE
ncbi:MAG: glycoside hydrolase family 172 protein [Mangrovibacterium sp.]